VLPNLLRSRPSKPPHPDFSDLLSIERRLYARGLQRIAGTDEAGRGCLAGPVFAGAVILPVDCRISGVNDSKLLSPAQREALFGIICAEALAWAVASVDAPEIDRINIHRASLKAMALAVEALVHRPDYLLIDGKFTLKEEYFFVPQEAVVDGDALSQSVAAASILAKVSRDRWISEEGKKYPDFNFAKHKGYATADHRREIREFGLTPLHRRSFRCL